MPGLRSARDGARGSAHAAGTLPSAPDASFCVEVLCQRVIARQGAIRGRNLTPTWNSEFLSENVAMRFRGPW